jgi:hypothetical protein
MHWTWFDITLVHEFHEIALKMIWCNSQTNKQYPSFCHTCNKQHASAIMFYSQVAVYVLLSATFVTNSMPLQSCFILRLLFMSFLPRLWQTACLCNLVFLSGRCLCPSFCHVCDKQHASAILFSCQVAVYLFNNYLEKVCVSKNTSRVSNILYAPWVYTEN